MYLVFDTLEQATIAIALIGYNMGLTGSITVRWAEPQVRKDGKYVIPKPELDEHMLYVSGYAEEEYSTDWFAVAGLE